MDINTRYQLQKKGSFDKLDNRYNTLSLSIDDEVDRYIVARLNAKRAILDISNTENFEKILTDKIAERAVKEIKDLLDIIK